MDFRTAELKVRSKYDRKARARQSPVQIIWPDEFTFVSKHHPDGLSVPAQDVSNYASVIADQLAAQNVAPGDRVALWLTDGADKIAAALGCWMVGAVFCVLPSFAGNTKTERSQSRSVSYTHLTLATILLV